MSYSLLQNLSPRKFQKRVFARTNLLRQFHATQIIENRENVSSEQEMAELKTMIIESVKLSTRENSWAHYSTKSIPSRNYKSATKCAITIISIIIFNTLQIIHLNLKQH